jgi:hypothetical protein
MPKRPQVAPSASAGGFVFASGWFLLCLFLFLRHKPISWGTDRFPPFPSPLILTPFFLARTTGLLLRLTLFWAAAWRLGRWLLTPLRKTPASRLEEFLLSLGLGAGALGLAALGLGVCGFLFPRLLMILLAGLAAAAVPDALRLLQDRGAAKRLTELGFEVRARGLAPAVLLVLLVAYEILVALGPTVFFDSLVYHLALPDLYLRHGAVVATPLNAFAGIPAGVEMLFVWLLPWGGSGSLCQLLHLSLGALAAAAIIAAGRRLGSLRAGLWGAAIFFSNPSVLLEGGRPAVELGWCFYLALAVVAALVAVDTNDDGWLTPVGLLAGFALGTKYPAIFLPPALAVLLVRVHGWKRGLRSGLKVVAIAVLAAAPWGLRNIAFYRNPVFPFLGGTVFAPNAADLPALASPALAPDFRKMARNGEGAGALLAHPWSESFPREADDADNVVSCLYLAFLPLFFLRPLPVSVRRLILFAGCLWLPMNALTGVARLSIPMLIPLSLAFGLVLSELPGTAYAFAQAAAAAIIVLNGIYAHSKTIHPLWRFLSGEIPEAVYLAHSQPTYPVPPYAAFAWANAHLPSDAKVLLVGEPRSFYLERVSETSSPYAPQPLAVYANDSADGDELYRRLLAAGFTYLIINERGMGSLGQTMKMSERGFASLVSFWGSSLAEVYVDSSDAALDARSSKVYRLLTPEERARSHSAAEVPFAGTRRPEMPR